MNGDVVLVPRAGRAPSALALRLEQAGVRTLSVPSLRFDATPVDRLQVELANVEAGDVVAFTSANAVRSVARIEGIAEAWRGVTLAATGPATARVVERELGAAATIVPERYVAESFAEALLAAGAAERRVWLPRASVARDVLPNALRAAGADVRVVVAYDAVVDVESAGTFAALRWPSVRLIAVTSSRTLQAFDGLLTGSGQAAARETPVASIGPITSTTARELGYPVALEAPMSTMDALADAIVAWLPSGDLE